MKKKKIENNLMLQGILMLVITFLGFAIGRIGHVIAGYQNGLHHWIPALLIVFVSPFFYKFWWWKLILAFGIGLFISDFNDFTKFEIISPDMNDNYVFWGVD